MLKVSSKQSKATGRNYTKKTSLVVLIVIAVSSVTIAFTWAYLPHLLVKIESWVGGALNEPKAEPSYDLQRAEEFLSERQKDSEIGKAYGINSMPQKLFAPVNGNCDKCFDVSNPDNGPDQFYFAARTRFHQQKIEEGMKYLELAAKQGHPASIHSLALVYEEGAFVDQSFKRAYLYFRLLSIYAEKFERKILLEHSERAIQRLEVHLSGEDFGWIGLQIEKLNVHGNMKD